MNPIFPPILYAVLDDTTEDAVFITSTDPATLGSPGAVTMGRYVLQGTGEVVNEVKYVETATV